jgi:hypothetical protein
MAEQPRSDDPYRRLTLLLGAVARAWMIYLVAMLVSTDRWEIRSLFGETFGALEALFSGLAFAGLIYTIALQRRELQLQREELRLTRDELRRTASAQEQSEASLKQQSETMLLTARINAMTLIVNLQRVKHEVNRDRQTMGFGFISRVNLRQFDDYIAQLEAVLASNSQEPQQREGAPDAPADR